MFSPPIIKRSTFFLKHQLEYHFQTEKGLQQIKIEKLNTEHTKHSLPEQRESPWEDKPPSRHETLPFALHTAQAHELPYCNLFSHA